MITTQIRAHNSKAINALLRRDGHPATQQRHYRKVDSITTFNTTSITLIDTIPAPFTIIRAQLKGSNFQVHIAFSDILLSNNAAITIGAATQDSRLSGALAPEKGFVVADQFKPREHAHHRPDPNTSIKLIARLDTNITLPVRFAADIDIKTYPNA
jgi:hypothetical protein